MSAKSKLGACIAAGAIATLLSACNGIIGITQIVAAPDGSTDGGLPPIDGSAPGDATVNGEDGATNAGDSSSGADAPVALADSSVEDAGVEAGCPAGTLTCDGGCVANGPENCGVCGHDCTSLPHVSGQVTCGAGGTCAFPATACAPGYAHCGDGGTDQGCETSVETTGNCGACAVACTGGTPDCAGSGSTYACASGCTGAQTLCGSTCVDTSQDANNCNACGNACTTSVSHATPTCSGSACGYACNSGYTSCNGECADYLTDNNNCGGCNNVCSPGTECSNGTCVCNSGTNCPGCCSGNTCETYGNQSAASCGFGGASCGACAVSGETCSSGQCACPGGDQNCGGTCVDVSGSDSNNCGACGHNCYGGTCASGVCQPTTLITSGCFQSGLTTDGTTVYYSSQCGTGSDIGGIIYSCLGTGCAAAPTALIPEGQPTGQVLYLGGTLYWVDLPKKGYTADVVKCQPGSGTCTTSTFGSLVTGGIATNGTNMYWWDNTTPIQVCSIASCTPTQFVAATSSTGGPFDIAADATTVFWTDSSAGTVMSCPATSTACASATTIASARTSPTVLATDGANVYWSDAAGLLECPVGGCGGSPVLLAFGQQNANSIVTDATYVYWATGSSIVRAKIGVAGSAVTIAPNQTGAATVGVGQNGVYWSLSSGNIMLLAK